MSGTTHKPIRFLLVQDRRLRRRLLGALENAARLLLLAGIVCSALVA